MAKEADYGPYEASDEASENELLDRSLSLWKGWCSYEKEQFAPVALDMFTASSIGHFDCMRSIISRGEVELNARNKGGWTPLMYASYIGHDNIVSMLLEKFVNVNIKNHKGQTALMLTASCGNESVGFFLCQQGAELEATDNKGWTALFHATYAGHQNMVKFLLEQGANLNAVEPSKGMTPFMQAAIEGHEIVVQVFLQYGVDANARAYNCDTARSLALMYSHIKIVSLIDNHLVGTRCLTIDSGLEGDLSSSDEAFVRPRNHPSSRQHRGRTRPPSGPSIRDGPEAFARLIDRNHNHDAFSCPNVPRGYMTFPPADIGREEVGSLCYRDVTSPINPADYNLDSSGGRDCPDNDEDSNAFSKTGALTIKSGSSSSGGLVAAFGISRDNSIDSDGAPDTDDLSRNSSSSTSSLSRELNEAMQHNKLPDHPPAHMGLPPPHSNRNVADQVLSMPNSQRSAHSDCKLPFEQPYPGHPLHQHTIQGNVRTREEQRKIIENRPQDLETLLQQLDLSKYFHVFQEQDVDLAVFLSLTDNDLKEIGIKLFGPRRKMTNAIARWHSNVQPATNDLEQAYADRLEAEMQEMAIQLHQAYECKEKLQTQVQQEQEIRKMIEECLMKERKHLEELLLETKHKCEVMTAVLQLLSMYYSEFKDRLMARILPQENRAQLQQEVRPPATDIVTALMEGLCLDTPDAYPSNVDCRRTSTEHLLQWYEKSWHELCSALGLVTVNCDALLLRSNSTADIPRPGSR